MINKKHGLGPQGINAIKQAKEAWDNPKEIPQIKKNPAKKLQSAISDSVFATLERDNNSVTDFVNRMRKKLENSPSSSVKIELGTHYEIGDDPILQEIFTYLISTDDSNYNKKVWQHFLRIIKTAFSDYKVKSNLNDSSTNIYEIVIEKQ